MSFKWSNIQNPVFVLAPMADITTLPFRSICKEMGADIVFTPMFSANAIIHNPKITLELAKFLPEEQPVIVQIFGYDGELIGKAAKIVQKELSPAGIDINMGCPAPKITGNECGSALLRDYDKALGIVKTVRTIYDGQLSVKLRLGWKDFDVLDFCKRLEEIGIDAVTIHGRTTKQGYTGLADWEAINKISQSLSIPVIGNGDITTWQEAYLRQNDAKVLGVMIGRAALGNPWIFKEIKEKKDINTSKTQIAEIAYKQAELSTEFYGERLGPIEMRKHLGWYLKGFAGAKELREQAVRVNSLAEIKDVLERFQDV